MELNKRIHNAINRRQYLRASYYHALQAARYAKFALDFMQRTHVPVNFNQR